MDRHAHLAQLEADGPLLAAAAERAGWDAPVPETEWTVRDLVTHIGGVHRWATAIVRDCSTTPDIPEGDAVGTGPADAELLEWFRDGHMTLVDTLRGAGPEIECVAFLPASSPIEFWCRRQAHETAIHRVDAEGAAGTRTRFDTAFAQDGIAEMLLGFAARKSNAIADERVLAVHPSDGQCWSVTMGGERLVAEPVDDPQGDAVVRGTSDDVYRWLWNRPSGAVVEGDVATAELWRSVRVRWS
jgi:uncharacterized protein (TIGR03083 family)